jgi:hypothetical protein
LAKLTAADRRALPASCFCGPNRSFPVPDLNHVRAAKALVGRSNLSDRQKKLVYACVVKKEEQLKRK